MIGTILLIIALVCFIAAAVNVKVGTLNIEAVGLAFLSGYFLWTVLG
jgi:hypothetical protein